MGSFRCYDSSNVIATLMMTNFHLNTTVVAIFLNFCLWRRSLCSDLVLPLQNCIEPPSYARTAYVVAIWPSFLFHSFVKIWATCEIFLGKWFTAPPWQKISRTPMVLLNEKRSYTAASIALVNGCIACICSWLLVIYILDVG